MTATIKVETTPCIACQKRSEMVVSEAGWAAFMKGALVQQAFPEMSADQRELLISGTHPKCWDEMFAGVEE